MSGPTSPPPPFDAVVIGAGAAGLFCAAQAGLRGVRVLLIDHAERVAEKIRISGGGRCNFTNQTLDPRAPQRHYLGEQGHFCRHALARYTPAHFMALLTEHGVPFHEKHRGQMFCDRSARDVIELLLRLCEQGGVQRWQPCTVRSIEAMPLVKLHPSPAESSKVSYQIDTDRGVVSCSSLVIATGGLSIPAIGASDFAHRVARRFGLAVVPPRPGLVPLVMDAAAWAPFAALAGVALPVRIELGEKKSRIAFDEDLLFTHRGLSGPAALQISSHWHSGQPIRVNLLPQLDAAAALREAKARSRRLIANELAQWLPQRLASAWVEQNPAWQRPIHEASDKALAHLAESLGRWTFTPSGTEGYKKAEVTVGGVCTRALCARTMQATAQPGLYFIGEAVDVTGWLGGYNFQWAWASAWVCAEALAA